MPAKTERQDGSMPAWAVWRDYWVRVGDGPFLDRKVLMICPWFGVFITRIHKPDISRHPHDHSRPFISLILTGGYSERVWDNPADLSSSTHRIHGSWSLHKMPVSKAHKIVAIKGTLRTLVVAGRSRGTWAFWTQDGKVDWKEYG